MSQAWVSSHARFQSEKNLITTFLTINNFEILIDILEKNTGFAKETIPQVRGKKKNRNDRKIKVHFVVT